jgi:hypothetical protein
MADRKISDLTALTTPASGDYLPIVDISEAAAASKNKRITIEELMRGVPDGTAAAPGIAFETDPNTGIYRPGADQLAVATNGTGRLFIDASGRVGVGTASPVAQLQSSVTDGTISIASAGTTKALRIIHDSTTTGIEGVDTTLSASYQPLAIGGSYLVFATEGAERLRITSAGLVGIGNSAPLSKLDVQTAVDGLATIARFYNLSNVSAATESAIDLQADQSASRISNLRDGAGTFGTTIISNTAAGVMGERLRITSAGLVGIGTSSVGARLHIRDGSNVNLYGAANGAAFQWTAVNDSASAYIDYIQNALTVQFQTGGSERARIDSSGRLLVGTSTSTNFIGTAQPAFLQLKEDAGTFALGLQRASNDASPSNIAFRKTRSTTDGGVTAVADGDALGQLRFIGTDGTGAIQAALIRCDVDGTPGANNMPGRIVLSTTASGSATPTERMRITNDGSVLLNTAGNTIDPATGTVDGAYYNNSARQLILSRDGGGSLNLRRRSSDGTVQGFYRDGTVVGTISVTTTATAYNTSSDYRLKENVTPVSDGITRLQQLKPSRFNFIADPDTVVDGFIAHEAQAVVPECVTGGKDAVDDDGNPEYQGIDQSKLVPLLTAALQEAIAKIEILEARLTAAGIE